MVRATCTGCNERFIRTPVDEQKNITICHKCSSKVELNRDMCNECGLSSAQCLTYPNLHHHIINQRVNHPLDKCSACNVALLGKEKYIKLASGGFVHEDPRCVYEVMNALHGDTHVLGSLIRKNAPEEVEVEC